MGILTPTDHGGPRPINIWLESLTSRAISAQEIPEAKREALAQKDEAILLLLAKLAIVYWRPDFTPQQAKQLYSQYLDDLREFAFADIAGAVQTFRRDPENKFFPLPGQLRGLITTPYSWDPNPRDHVKYVLKQAEVELEQICANPALLALSHAPAE